MEQPASGFDSRHLHKLRKDGKMMFDNRVQLDINADVHMSIKAQIEMNSLLVSMTDELFERVDKLEERCNDYLSRIHELENGV